MQKDLINTLCEMRVDGAHAHAMNQRASEVSAVVCLPRTHPVGHCYLTQSIVKSCCRNQFPHKSVNVFFTITYTKNESTDLCRNRLWQNDFKNTVCEINFLRSCAQETTNPRQAHQGSSQGTLGGVLGASLWAFISKK